MEPLIDHFGNNGIAMRVLLITSFFPPTHTAGTEKRTFGYATELLRSGHDVRVVCAGEWTGGPQNFNGFTDETYRNVPVRRLKLNWTNGANPNQALYRNALVEQQIGQYIIDWKPDIVHITSCLTLSASVISAAKKHDIPVVLTLTDYWFICPRLSLLRSDGSLCDGCTSDGECLECMLSGSNLYRRSSQIIPNQLSEPIWIWASQQPYVNRLRGLRGMALDFQERRSYLREMITLADCVTAPSSWLRDVLYESGVTKEIEVIYSGHDLRWLEDMPEAAPSDRIRIGYIGQIIPVKGLHILIEAFISSASGRAQLSIYGAPSGDSEYMFELEGLSADLGEEIYFNGPFPHERLGEVLSDIDVLIVPSTWHENNPRVIQEAFASGTPIIASNVGGIAEFVKHEVNGLLFERGEARDLERQLLRILEEPGLLERLQEGIQPVKTIHQEVNELEAIYYKLTTQ
jgi:glycosyltransferase involved in cell wall biosynthesis